MIKGLTGLRVDDNEDSKKFCLKTKVYNNFKDLIDTLDCKYVFISYSSDGILQLEDIFYILSNNFKETVLKQQAYKRFKSSSNSDKKPVEEYLICAKSKNFM